MQPGAPPPAPPAPPGRPPHERAKIAAAAVGAALTALVGWWVLAQLWAAIEWVRALYGVLVLLLLLLGAVAFVVALFAMGIWRRHDDATPPAASAATIENLRTRKL